jgi:hypothetical protein
MNRMPNQKRLRLTHIGVAAATVLLAMALVFWPHRMSPPAPPQSAASWAGNDVPAGRHGPWLPEDSRPQPALRQAIHLTAATVQRDAAAQFGAISGRVLSSSTDQGVARAELTFSRSRQTHSVAADENGNFVFAAPEPGHYVLAEVVAAGYFPFAPSWGTSAVHVEARPGLRVDNLLVFLVPAIDYVGTAFSREHQPVSGAHIEVIADTEEDDVPATVPGTLSFNTVSDGQGRFQFHAQDFATVVATHPRFGVGRAVVDRTVQITHELSVLLGPLTDNPPATANAVIAGKVVDSQGAALAGIEVAAGLFGTPAERAAAPQPKTKTNGGGEFSLGIIDGHRYSVVARAEGLVSARAENVPANTRGLVLRLLEPVGSIAGNVHSSVDDGPVVAFTAVVMARSQEGIESVLRQASFVDPDGRFVIDELPVGQSLVQIFAHGYAPSAQQPVRVSGEHANNLEIRMPRGGCVSGTVTDATTHAPLAQAKVSLESGLADSPSAMPFVTSVSTDPEGKFRLCGISEGLRSVLVAAFRHNSQILSGLALQENGEAGPLEVGLQPVAPGQAPQTELVGIGAQLSRVSDGLLIGKILDGGGAALVGLVAGDTIQKIDGNATTELEFQQAIEQIRGTAGSVITLTVKKVDGSVVDINVPRRPIKF